MWFFVHFSLSVSRIQTLRILSTTVIMFKIVSVVLFVSACVSGAIIPDVEVLTSPTEPPVASENQNLLVSTDINEISVENEPKVCSSAECAKESALMRSYIDDSINPCDDFYQFACGKFIKETTLPDDKSSLSSYLQVHDNVQKQLQTVLTEESSPNEPKPFRLAKDFYKMCMDERTLNANGGMKEIFC